MRRCVLGAAVLAILLSTTPALGQAAPSSTAQTITATGTGRAQVAPKNRHSNASIVAAVNRAHRAAIAGALRQAHENALGYATAVGMKLGSVISVSDAQTSPFFGPGPIAGVGPFGPSQYCGTIRQPVGRPLKGKPPKFKTVHRCLVPRFAFTTLTVTYAASS